MNLLQPPPRPSLLALLVAFGCASPPAEDGRDDPFFVPGAADTGSVAPGSAVARCVLALVNSASRTQLVDDVGLSDRAADNLVAYRLGDDGAAGTADDERFDSLVELDAVPFVGPIAFDAMAAHVRAAGCSEAPLEPPPPASGGCAAWPSPVISERPGPYHDLGAWLGDELHVATDEQIEVYRLRPDGTLEWRRSFASGLRAVTRLYAFDDRLLLLQGYGWGPDRDTRTLRVLDAADGTELASVVVPPSSQLVTRPPLAFFVGGRQLSVLDLGEPRAPAWRGRVALAEAHRAATHGASLFVAERGAGVKVLDVSDPDAPRFLARLAEGVEVLDVAARDGLVVALESENVWPRHAEWIRVAVYDAARPDLPALGQVEVPFPVSQLFRIGDALYVQMYDQHWPLDLSVPSRPRLGAAMNFGSFGAGAVPGGPHRDRVVTRRPPEGPHPAALQVIDLTVAPRILGHVSVGPELALQQRTRIVSAAGHLVRGRDVLRPGGEALLTEVARLPLEARAARGALVYGVDRAATDEASLVAFDLSDPAAPVEVSRTPLAWTHQLRADGDRLFALGAGGVTVLDIAAGPPAVRGRIATAFERDVTRLRVAGRLLLVQHHRRVEQWRIERGSSPWLETTLALSGRHREAVVAMGPRRMVTSRGRVFDLGPSRPIEPAFTLPRGLFAALLGPDARLLAFGSPGLALVSPRPGATPATPARPYRMRTQAWMDRFTYLVGEPVQLDGRVYHATTRGVLVVELCR